MCIILHLGYGEFFILHIKDESIMKREEFIATVGYQGDTALVDRNILSAVKGLNTNELLEKGLFKAAFCSALFSSSKDNGSLEEKLVLDYYNSKNQAQIPSVDGLKRLFGVYNIPENIEKTTLI